MVNPVIHERPAAFKELYISFKEADWTDGEIATHFEVSPTMISRWKKAVGLEKSKTGPKKAEMPERFANLYIEYKEKGVTDEQIAAELFIHRKTLSNWKRAVGFKAGQFTKPAAPKVQKAPKGRQRKLAPYDFKEYYLQNKKYGKPDREIAEENDISIETLRQWKLAAGFTKGQFFRFINTVQRRQGQ